MLGFGGRTPVKAKRAAVEDPSETTSQQAECRVVARRLQMDATSHSPERLLPLTIEKPSQKPKNRLQEAKQCVIRAKTSLGNSRNIKTEIKAEVTTAIDRLYQLVKEGESAKGKQKEREPDSRNEPEKDKEPEKKKEIGNEESELIKKMEEHAKLIQENNNRIEKLKETIEKNQEFQERQSYANVAATGIRRQPQPPTALHSVIVTAKDETETGEEVLDRIRKAVNAKEGGIVVENIRKAKDRKVIVGCKTEKDREQIMERLKRAEQHLNVQEVKNKDPLVILKDVFLFNSDEDIIEALWTQNEKILEDLDRAKNNVEIIYRKRARNPQVKGVVMRVSPGVWQRLVDAESVKIDLQRVKVADQSPLVQCSLCLGYGHSRRLCTETVEKCCHCGGPHVRADCADWLAGAAPTCCNCTRAKYERADHNAFSNECPIRRRWDTIARATIAYQC